VVCWTPQYHPPKADKSAGSMGQAQVKCAALLFCEGFNPDEIKAKKISLGRRGRQRTHGD